MPKKKTKNKAAVFTVADARNMPWAKRLENSLRYFHSEKELPFHVIGPEQIAAQNDPDFFYRATPKIGLELLKDYDTVIKIDADSIITGDLNHILENTAYDLGCVLNSNPREYQKLQVSVWNIHPYEYVNAGFVAMRDKETVQWWLDLCNSRYFPQYQYREQDLLNIIFWYGPRRMKRVIFDHSENWHGLVSKGYWPLIDLNDKKELILPKNEEWNTEEDKTIKVIHVGGGNDPDKMKLSPYFKEEVLKRLEELTNERKV